MLRPSAWFALLAVLLLVATAKAADVPLPFGISFSFLHVDVGKANQCAAVSHSATIKRGTFLPRYDDPLIRKTVRQELAEMRHSGFDNIRTLVFFGSGPKVSSDWFDVAKDKQRASKLVRQYIQDVAAAGFKRMILNYAVQGTASPSCRDAHWGDCFDQHTVADTVSFIDSIRDALGDPPPLPMIFEVGPEQCVTDKLPPLLKSTLTTYVRSVLGSYTTRYPRDETTISCSIKRFAAARHWIDSMYAMMGRSPFYYQIHAYHQREYSTSREFSAVANMLRNTKTPVIIGETSYGDNPNLSAILSELRGIPLKAVYFWPLANASDKCAVDVAPPYKLHDALGTKPKDMTGHAR
jgi:hypothetical protein